jgi:hypothetical protein
MTEDINETIARIGVLAPEREALDVLVLLLEAADEYGADIPDHRCYPTDHETAFWNARYAAARYVRAVREAQRQEAHR